MNQTGDALNNYLNIKKLSFSIKHKVIIISEVIKYNFYKICNFLPTILTRLQNIFDIFCNLVKMVGSKKP